ncbi:MAG: aminotransferase class I/II-fold pyridoxal phosphate-dependent enzyme [Burkholderiaceae bacterium]
MPHERIARLLADDLAERARRGSLKGDERVIADVAPPGDMHGLRYHLAGYGERRFLRMNANNYLGLSLRGDVIAADEHSVRGKGTGPGAVRFISGTWSEHVALESAIAAFHGREAAMLFSSAYATMMGVLPCLIGPQTAVISDALNHNCIINAMRLGQPQQRLIYRHLDLDDLERQLVLAADTCRRAIIVTDGVFSMRGDHAPLARIGALARRFDDDFAENVLVIVDDSHGVGAFGDTGRGTEQVSGGEPADVLIGTLGKAFGVNGGYVTAAPTIIAYLRENSPFYVYSNPISPAEAAAAQAAIEFVDGPAGKALLDHLRAMTRRLRDGIVAIGLETLPGEHPVVPLVLRDTPRTRAVVEHLFENDILATGLGYPVVPKGEEEIRFQVCADHTAADIDQVLQALANGPALAG